MLSKTVVTVKKGRGIILKKDGNDIKNAKQNALVHGNGTSAEMVLKTALNMQMVMKMCTQMEWRLF